MSTYLKYTIKNMEPVRIVDDSNSQSGQTETLRYIPGTTIRGMIIHALSEKQDFEEIKKELFSSRVRYLNAYISTDDEELLPSPKGFYEDKTNVEGKKQIQNVVLNGEFSEGYKRAALGRYCYMESDCIHYYNVDIGSDMKIKININKNEEQNVFRNDYIAAGHTFTGYIIADRKDILEKMKDIFSEKVILGNGRSAGLGKCRVINCDYSDTIPYAKYMADTDQENECYMMLVSNLIMRDQKGEICGFSEEMLKKLEEKMQVKNLKIGYCATSVIDVRGYNRTWGIKTPSMRAYEQGSVFHLCFDGLLKTEKMQEISEQGIGIRLNEGFGRVLFLKNYEKINYKIAEAYFCKENKSKIKIELSEEDKEVLKNTAKIYYRNLIQKRMEQCIVLWAKEHEAVFGRQISNSQLGSVEAFLMKNRYNPEEAKRTILDYLKHAEEKEENNNTQKQHGSVKVLKKFINKVFQEDFSKLLGISKTEIMGYPVKELLSVEEIERVKLELLIEMIKYKNKGEN